MITNFPASLSRAELTAYKNMQLTNYVLLCCAEYTIPEKDEYESRSKGSSLTWIHSFRPTLDELGVKEGSYPEGSLSSNRIYLQALESFRGGEWYSCPENEEKRQEIIRFLKLRRDDSSGARSLLFGSSYSLSKDRATKSQRTHRIVEVSIRHSAAALWMLLKISKGANARIVSDSLAALGNSLRSYLSNEKEWRKDPFPQLTISSAIATLELAIDQKIRFESRTETQSLVKDLKSRLLSPHCFEEDIDGTCRLKLPPPKDNIFSGHEHFLVGFVLCQVPTMLAEPKMQGLLSSMLSNRLKTDHGTGIPVRRRSENSSAEALLPDFGISATALYLVWYCLRNRVGSDAWQKACKDSFVWLKDFCLNVYDNPTYYTFILNENSAKVLLLPRADFSAAEMRAAESVIQKVQRILRSSSRRRAGNIDRKIADVEMPANLGHVKGIIKKWHVGKYRKKRSPWRVVANWITWKIVLKFIGTLAAILTIWEVLAAVFFPDLGLSW